jgi:hypothetical protein
MKATVVILDPSPVILNEVKNLTQSVILNAVKDLESSFAFAQDKLRLKPQNDIKTQSLGEGAGRI